MPQYLDGPAKPLGNYSHAVLTTWPLIHVSGQVGVDSEGKIPADLRAQADLVLDNIAAVLAGCRRSLRDVVYLRVYVTSTEAAAAWRAARDARLDPPYPASALVQVVALSSPEWAIEVEAVAEHSTKNSLDAFGQL